MRSVLIVASGPVRERLEQLLDSLGVAISGWADDPDKLDGELASEADVILADATAAPLDDLLDSLQEARVLREAKVILLTEEIPPEWVNWALRAGVRAVLPVEIEGEQLGAALDAVARGLLVTHPSGLSSARSAATTADESSGFLEPLTAREREVLRMLSEGLGNKEIGSRLKISEHTVKFHVASILSKLGASTRTEAVSIALRRGLILV
jgi:NarL family two-component system response regulator YdfI